MNKLFLITGPAGVGKSTISKLLAKKLEKSVLIEGDDLYHIVKSSYVAAWKPGNHLKFFWKNVILLINNSLNNGYDVVFNYIINKEDYEMLKAKFKDANIIFKVLLVSEEELLRRDSLRNKDCQMKDRCIILLNDFKKQDFNKENIIDTTNLSIEETLKEVVKWKRIKIKEV